VSSVAVGVCRVRVPLTLLARLGCVSSCSWRVLCACAPDAACQAGVCHQLQLACVTSLQESPMSLLCFDFLFMQHFSMLRSSACFSQPLLCCCCIAAVVLPPSTLHCCGSAAPSCLPQMASAGCSQAKYWAKLARSVDAPDCRAPHRFLQLEYACGLLL
jgi:hypothetical protein